MVDFNTAAARAGLLMDEKSGPSMPAETYPIEPRDLQRFFQDARGFLGAEATYRALLHRSLAALVH